MAASEGQTRFDQRRGQCDPAAVEVIDFLMTVATNAGPNVTHPPTAELKGEGFKYEGGHGQFCALHLRKKHVWVWIKGADRATLAAEGFEPSKQEEWFTIPTMPKAVRFVKWILWAHDAAIDRTVGRK